MSHDYRAVPVVLDIDGTVCDNGHRIDWSNPHSVERLCRPMPDAVKRVREMVFDGWLPFFLTARGRVLFDVTFKQIREWFGHDVAQRCDLVMSSVDVPGRLSYHDRRAVAQQDKADALRDFLPGECIMVGDNIDDLLAAEGAGARFMWAHDWRAGMPLESAPFARHIRPVMQERVLVSL